MTHAPDRRDSSPTHFNGQAGLLTACVFLCVVFSGLAGSSRAEVPSVALTATPPPMSECPSRLDSLIISGNRCLDRLDIQCARHCFTQAYKCGMSKDSMCYFAAELYIRSFALDTALAFNRALEIKGRLKRELFIEQRSRIFRMIGWQREADSLAALIRKKERHDIALNVYASRSVMGLTPLTLAPAQRSFSIPEDIDDIGNGNVSYQWSRHTGSWPKRIFLRLDAASDAMVPTRHSYDEKNDTLVRSIGLAAGAGDFPVTPEFLLGHRMDIHEDGKIDHFSKLSFVYPVGTNRFLAAKHETKWTSDQGIDNSRTELLFTQVSHIWKCGQSGSISLSHHFSKSSLYQNKLGTTGIYKAVPIGYVDNVDSLKIDDYFRYVKNPLDTARVTLEGFGLNDYWAAQPRLKLVTVPEHDVNATLSWVFRVSLPFRMDVNLTQSIQGIWFPEKLRWYSFIPINQADFFDIQNLIFNNDYAIVYNTADGKCYLNDARGGATYAQGRLKEITVIAHEKTRIDCYITVSANLEKALGKIGKFYFSSTYAKGFSTLTKADPVVGLDYYWGIQAGWKKDISFAR
jgi:hypothetical protein